MLDAFKSTFGNGGKGRAQQTAEMNELITSAREERAALTEMLTQVTVRSNKLAQVGKSLEQVGQKAAAAAERLDELGKRLEQLDQRTKAMEEADARMQELLNATRQAQQAAEKVAGPGGELQKHRETIQQLSSQALETQASIETLKKERAALEEMRAHLRQTQTDAKKSLEHATISPASFCSP